MANPAPVRMAATNAVRIEAARKRELGWIHQAKAALQWSDDDYRYHLQQQTGKASAKDLTASERAQFLRHLNACGWSQPRQQSRPFDQAAKIRWYWRKLAAIGAVREPAETGLLAFIAMHTGVQVSSVQLLPSRPASNTIEALKAWLHREERKGAVKE